MDIQARATSRSGHRSAITTVLLCAMIGGLGVAAGPQRQAPAIRAKDEVNLARLAIRSLSLVESQ